jgi:MFS family permease
MPDLPAERQSPLPHARLSLILLLSINLFNYIDRYVLAAVVPRVCHDLLGPETRENLAKMGSLVTVFTITYMIAAPIFGWLADRMSRWILCGIAVLLWSLASGASGLALTFTTLLLTRMFIGIGEAGYGPAAPTLISDLYPVSRRGQVLAWFYMAIPVGSAAGYILGGFIASRFGWRTAFYVLAPPGILLGALCFLMREPPRGTADSLSVDGHGSRGSNKPTLRDYLNLFRIPSYLLDTAGMMAMTFAIGGISFWMPHYIVEHRFKLQYGHEGSLSQINFIFGALTAVAGFIATFLGGYIGDKLRNRFSGSYFLVSGVGIVAACPCVVAMLYLPFPYAWIAIFLAEFCLFFNTGPSNAILANVTHPKVRASAFALNIFLIHAFGDAASPPILGYVAGYSWNAAFYLVVAVMGLAGVLWMAGAKYLERDTAVASGQSAIPA